MEKKQSEYSKKLLDPRWQKKRLEILQRDEFTCQSCFDTENTLHVHHRRYFPGREPWDIDNKFLVTLCASCHQEETDLWPDVSHDLIAILKESFFASDVKEIASSFINIPIYYDTHVTASIIAHWLSTPDLLREMGDRYFDSLKAKRGLPPSNDVEF